jgi:hypothetical protein
VHLVLDVVRHGPRHLTSPCLLCAQALYCLVLFYQATKEELAQIKPLPKFIVIKAIVFFTFWQAILIDFLESNGVLAGATGSVSDPWSERDIGTGIQNFCITVEMFFFAVAHHWAFPPKVG